MTCSLVRRWVGVQQVQYFHNKYGAKGKKVYFGFVGLDKTFDRVSREVVCYCWTMCTSGVEC